MKYNITISAPWQPPETIYGITIEEAYTLQSSRPGSSITFRPQLWLSKVGGIYTIDYITESVGITLATAETVIEAKTIIARYEAMDEAQLHATIGEVSV